MLSAAAVSNFASLIYYVFVNASAIKMKGAHYPRSIPVIGLVSCVILIPFLGTDALLSGIVMVIAVTIAFYAGKRLAAIRWRRLTHNR
ncbi:MAG: hypothetical protein A4E32_00318 [Methanomassiliicoccales archaeon PtaU1.Bin124]|nr:MAG: hypothetical protein A4E32_00318 [Methanomassiliicoccales archaeon PtaU1.Bin124]